MPSIQESVRCLALVLTVLLLAACGDKPFKPLPANSVVLAFGDSLTYGVGADDAQSYPAVLAQKTGWQIVNAGVPGETAAQARQRFSATLDDVKPRLVLLCLGGNDFLQKLPAEQTKAELGLMLDELKRRNLPVLLIGVPKLGLGLETPALYHEVAEAYQVPLNEDSLAQILAKSSLKSDLVHPNAAGYRQLADELADQLADLGALRQ
ncbi:arylesterase [Chitinibacter sp. SCUT-21]|uniref:arylesterase n=1 Tax=Chitinibacter sp. SCUT-21 TaxID=2970891 RepID=UPI0035A6FD33